MLQLSSVRKSYTTADFTQVALDDVTISFRDNEFVAILGPSGSGKTTLLNIIGGLDHYDSGDLVIDGISTEKYRDRDWDAYRNNRIGFVFQSYNLIPHQTILANVELALTLSGVSRAERKQRAIAALEQVGLGDHIHKRPSQLSGGQMQRVAIARALINDPEILLADEPTGALDSKTSVQIMALLTEIANDRLVVMVTHNPDLAEEYATRIVNLNDGQVSADSDPFLPTADEAHLSEKPTRKTSMSFLTAIALSFNNLMTKKGRTLMTSFAGSIGIIGIAAILALANGVNDYIKSVEEDTLSVYPLSIQSQGFDMMAMLTGSMDLGSSSDDEAEGSAADGKIREVQMLTRMFESVGSNDLAALKVFLDGNGGGIENYANSIQYSYNVTPRIFNSDTADGVRQVNPDTTFAAMGLGGGSGVMAQAMSTNIFHQMVDDTSLIEQQYDVVAGDWPQDQDELVVVLAPGGQISDFVLYSMGLRDPAELDRMVKQMINDEPIDTPTTNKSFTYDQLLDVKFKLVGATDFYQFDKKYDVWTDKSGDKKVLKDLVNKGKDLHVVGIVQPKEGATATALQPGIYYRSSLITYLIESAAQTEIVKQQLADPATNVFSGRTFEDEEKNPTREDFDMSSLMTVDEEAIAAAFTFDESKLSIDPSALDISMAGLDIDPSSLPQMDLGDIMGDLSLDDMAANIDVDSILADIDLGSADIDLGVDQEQITDLSRRMMEAYVLFRMNNVGAPESELTFEAFLETLEGQALADEALALSEQANTGVEEFQEKYAQQIADAIGAAVQQQIEANSAAMQAQIQAAMAQYMGQAMEALTQQIGTALEQQISGAMETMMGQLAGNMSSAMGIDQEAFMDAFKFNMDEEELAQLMMTMMPAEASSFDGNLARLGYADFDRPSSIDIYPKDFESKGQIIEILDQYNADMKAQGKEERVITYTDVVGALMSSVTDIVNVISYVLVAFVAISLVVSSIMIGVITYISVLERKKEIGILRSIGASKRDIRRVFNAETLIVGFVAGLIGITVTVLITIPANAIVAAKFAITQVAQLPWQAAAILVAISMGLTFLAGLIPSSAASRKDPVEALRSE